MRTPLTYYGGKQQLAHRIVALMPAHRVYFEPFCGGAAVLFAKPRADRETLNDIDSRVVRFWRVLRDRPQDLADAVANSPYSREEWREADALGHQAHGSDPGNPAGLRRAHRRLSHGRGREEGRRMTNPSLRRDFSESDPQTLVGVQETDRRADDVAGVRRAAPEHGVEVLRVVCPSDQRVELRRGDRVEADGDGLSCAHVRQCSTMSHTSTNKRPGGAPTPPAMAQRSTAS